MDSQNVSNFSSPQELNLRGASFEEVLPLWREKLWPERKSAIRPTSPIQMDLSYDPGLLKQNAVFLAMEFRNQIIGVISGFKTSEDSFRIRGLYIVPDFRGLGLSQKLISEICHTARDSGAKFVWSLPRKSAWPAYRTFGFYQVSDWFIDGMEFGPNCVAKLNL